MTICSRRSVRSSVRNGVLLLCGLILIFRRTPAQEAPGHSIGKVSAQKNLIVLELNDAALGNTNLFNLVGRTLRFTPEGALYRVESGALQWDADFGPESTGPEVNLHQFAFPFSGTQWNSFLVGTSGSIRFGTSAKNIALDPYGRPEAGLSLDRFDQLAEVASTLIDRAPAICVFLKPRMSGPHYVKELQDRVIITWDLTEPFGSLLDFTWFKTVNRFQAILHADGSIEMSYQEVSAKDAIVGIYPALTGKEKALATFSAGLHPSLPPHLDVQKVRLSILDAALLKITFETRGPVPAEENPAVEGITYRIHFNVTNPQSARSLPTITWEIQGMKDPYNPSSGPAKYFVFGPGVSPKVTVSGNSISL
ncbi:MAG TPA: hypothetical protein VFJ47_02850, partial [Terriglobales bacterium]|nr:hypothetical protein [Terriglobales bacterium]